MLERHSGVDVRTCPLHRTPVETITAFAYMTSESLSHLITDSLNQILGVNVIGCDFGKSPGIAQRLFQVSGFLV